ncbi:phage head closure protein [Rhizobium pusense]|uniref:Phage head-tail adaptor (Modular protein) n=1 Tax=Agrobacterium genomosp. 2 str. CFBP 5494 TaxID=1183436 RepID=A0A9W5AXX9_9HYPH|nr:MULTISPECIES: phage head closure protein [Rhizobium/Agrobacterium group]MDH0908409.1 phage head closure protein [Agrobacterium pusense]MDH1094241.1 phage head closure protein [Agrobacterium pusense]MDH1110823.1 phage head closure protein [Agrobacterium pusense]MDH2192173.1 phage head closure protein [Agrobacterium pusense]CAD7043649.1 head-tail adaptor protein [Rhizobium sp. P007]
MCKCGADFASSANTRIAVQSFVATDDDAGGREETWQDAFSAWAVVEPMAGREIYVNAQLQSRVDARITIRYRADLSDTTQAAKNRVKVGTRTYNITAVRNLSGDMKTEGTEFQQLFCVEGEPS